LVNSNYIELCSPRAIFIPLLTALAGMTMATSNTKDLIYYISYNERIFVANSGNILITTLKPLYGGKIIAQALQQFPSRFKKENTMNIKKIAIALMIVLYSIAAQVKNYA